MKYKAFHNGRIFYMLLLILEVTFAVAAEGIHEGPSIEKALYFAQSNQTDSAGTYLDQSLISLVRKKEADQWLDHVNAIGKIYRQVNPEYAVIYYQRYLEVALHIFGENNALIAEMYARTGDAYRQQSLGRYYESLAYFEKALGIYSNLQVENAFVGFVYHFTGSTYVRTGSYEKALSHLRKAIDIRLSLGDTLRAVQSYNNMGLVYTDLEKYNQALDCFNKGLLLISDDRKNSKVQLQKADLLLNRAECHMKMSGDHSVKSELDESLHIYNTNDNAWGQHAVNRALGKWHEKQHEPDLARLCYQKALAVGRSVYGNHHREVAKVYIDLGKLDLNKGAYDAALRSFQQSLVSLLNGLDDTLLLSDSQADQLYPEPWIMIALTNKAKVYKRKYFDHHQSDDLAKSYASLVLAVRQLDLLRDSYTYENDKQWLFGNYHQLLEDVVATAMEMASVMKDSTYWEQAFHFMEKSKSYSLLELLKGVQAKEMLGIPDSVLAHERNLRYRLAALNNDAAQDEAMIDGKDQQLLKARTAFERFSVYLREHYPAYYAIKYGDNTKSIKEIQQHLDDDETVALEYFACDSAIFLFAISPRHFKVFRIPTGNDFYKAVNIFRSSVSEMGFVGEPDRALQQFCDNAHFLYQKLLSPPLRFLSAQQESYRRVLIIPDGVISNLPFEAFIDHLPENRSAGYRDLPYLLKTHSIRYAYSVATLGYRFQLRDQRHDEFELIAFAPGFNDKGAVQTGAKLDHSLLETERISSMFKGRSFVRDEALKRSFLNNVSSYQIIHLATHAGMDEKDALNSYLLFSMDDDYPDSNRLYIYELFNLSLRADLVVLSACNTGTGKMIKGEGVMSLARGFAYAGCPTTVMSLWEVNDFATSHLMQYFYQSIKTGLAKDEALRGAKLEYLSMADEIKSHPFFWAGFVLQGDAAALKFHKGTPYQLMVLTSVALVLALVIYVKIDQVRKKSK